MSHLRSILLCTALVLFSVAETSWAQESTDAVTETEEDVHVIEAERAAAMAALKSQVVPDSFTAQLDAYQQCLQELQDQASETGIDPRETCRSTQAELEQQIPADIRSNPDQPAIPETIAEPVPVDLSASQEPEPTAEE